MSKDKEIKVQRLWNGLASVRDYVLIDCIGKKRNIVFKYNGEKMTVTWDRLSSSGFWTSKKDHISKYTGKKYRLIDFKFKKDEPESKQEELL